MINNKRRIYSCLWVFFLLCLSGNPLFCLNGNVREIYLASFFAIFTYRFLFNSKSYVSYVGYIWPFILISLFQIILGKADFSSPIFLMIKLYIGYSILQIVGKDFMRAYLYVTVIIAAISIPLFLYNLLGVIIPGIAYSDVGISIGIYTEVFQEYYGFIERNSGMFWEPGAFQGYLNIAIAFALLLPHKNDKKWKLQIGILVAALLTTKSTTGYLVFGFIVIYYLSSMSKIKPFWKFVMTLITILLTVYSYTSLEFMKEKIDAENSGELGQGGRIADYSKYSSYIISNFFIGLSDKIAHETPSGNGFISFLLYYGVFVVMYYFTKLYYNIKQQINTHCAVFFTIIIILTLQGEGFIFYPLYLVLPLISIDSSLTKRQNYVQVP